MRSSWKTLAAVAAALLVAPQLASATDEEVQEQLRLMQERMSQLEDKLQATDDQLEAANRQVESQQRVIEGAGLGERAGSNWLSSFLENTTFDGFVAASYNWNFNSPDESVAGLNTGTLGGENTGLLGNVAPHHQNHNNFQVDQVWFGMEKTATAESRGGFRVDLVYGAAADAQNPAVTVGFDDTGDWPHLYQAYVQYLAPVTEEGVSIKAGRYETIIGAESFREDSNYNITRGLVWGIQPVNHTGVLFEGNCPECGVDWALGIANNFTNTQADTDNSKTGMGRIRWTGETSSLAVAGLIGGDIDNNYFSGAGQLGNTVVTTGSGRDSDAIPMLDVVGTWDPSENLSMWINYTHIFDPISGAAGTLGTTGYNISVWGIAAAARLAISEDMGFSTRIEYLAGRNVFKNAPANFPGDTNVGTGDLDQWSVTATLDRALTEHLTLKVEGRYDHLSLNGAPDDTFICTDATCNGLLLINYDDDDQFMALVQLLYSF